MGVDPPRRVGDGAELERAPKPLDLEDVMRAQVNQAFVDFVGGEYPNPLVRGGDTGSEDAA